MVTDKQIENFLISCRQGNIEIRTFKINLPLNKLQILFVGEDVDTNWEENADIAVSIFKVIRSEQTEIVHLCSRHLCSRASLSERM